MSRHQLTSRIAYEIYVQRGRAPGRHREDWMAAETIVELCLAFAEQVVRVAAPETPAPEAPSIQEQAFALLEAAVEAMGRKQVAEALGYKSASTVGRYVRGDRPIGEKLAEKILSRLAPEPTVRLAA